MAEPNDETPHGDAGWRAIAADVISADDKIGFFGALSKLARAPVEGAIELAENQAYRGHQKFFATCLTLWISFGLVAVPWFVAWYIEEQAADTDNRAAALKLTVLQYFELAVVVVTGFFIYRFGATIERSPLSYYKFALISSGMALLLSILILIVRMMGIIALTEGLGDVGSEIVENPWVILAANLLTIVIALALLTMLNKRYWGLRTSFVVPATIAVASVDLGAVALCKLLLDVPAVDTFLQYFT